MHGLREALTKVEVILLCIGSYTHVFAIAVNGGISRCIFEDFFDGCLGLSCTLTVGSQVQGNAQAQGVDVRTYRIIYECIEEIEAAIKGMLKPVYRENVLGHAQVRQTIHVPNVGTIAGSYVQDGKITRASLIRVVRDGVVIFEDKISSLRRFKDDVKEVTSGYECGVGLEKFNDIKEGDILEAYIMEEIAR